MNADEALRATRKLIANPKRWTQDTLARNAAREPVVPYDPAAVCWCVEGALRKTLGGAGMFMHPAWAALVNVSCVAPSRVNDEKGHAATLAMVDAALGRELIGYGLRWRSDGEWFGYVAGEGGNPVFGSYTHTKPHVFKTKDDAIKSRALHFGGNDSAAARHYVAVVALYRKVPK